MMKLGVFVEIDAHDPNLYDPWKRLQKTLQDAFPTGTRIRLVYAGEGVEVADIDIHANLKVPM